jgi:hypothetical protein
MFTKHYKLQGRSEALVITAPADVVKEFQLSKGSKLQMSFDQDDRKLVIDLDSAAHRPRKTPTEFVAA